MSDSADQVRTTPMGAMFTGKPNYRRKDEDKRIANALHDALAPGGYNMLCADYDRLSKLAERFKDEARLPDMETANWLTECFYRAFKTATFDHQWGKKQKEGMLPDVAGALILAAIDLYTEAGPAGRTIQAYRNRVSDLVTELGAFADDVSGRFDVHRDFYAHLGRRVARAVLEHDLVEPPPRECISPFDYEAVEIAAAEQIVYFIGVGNDGPIKIGIAAKPHERLANLQTAHHAELSLLAITAGALEQERAYHGQFAAHRLKGEWFERHPDILAEIDRLSPNPR